MAGDGATLGPAAHRRRAGGQRLRADPRRGVRATSSRNGSAATTSRTTPPTRCAPSSWCGRRAGVPVMAHPFANGRGWTVDDEVIEAMADAGLAGLEAHHRDHRPARGRRTPSELAAQAGAVRHRVERLPRGGKENRLGENTTDPDGARADRGAGNERHRRGQGGGVNGILDLQTFGSVFVTLLVIMDPPGALPIFLGAHRLADPEAEDRRGPAGLARRARGHRCCSPCSGSRSSPTCTSRCRRCRARVGCCCCSSRSSC